VLFLHGKLNHIHVKALSHTLSHLLALKLILTNQNDIIRIKNDTNKLKYFNNYPNLQVQHKENIIDIFGRDYN